AVNGVLAGLFITLSFVTTGGISALLYLIAHLNVVLAIFNMLPIMPFDGSKIYKWSKPVYFVMVAVLIALYLAIRFI
ncbi:MAG: site-2 protease family protein, partial [Candidatus Methanomethylophilaceae archaeon]|nr:site-2 protease family protein [Candidatus Methanomethylophilaceae archaeon]